MREFYISIHSFQQMRDFVKLTVDQPFEVTVGNDNQRIDGKDLMGMVSLDLSRPVRVRMHCSEEEFTHFRDHAARFLA